MKAYITVNGRTYCDVLGTMAGIELREKTGVSQCSFQTVREANEAAKILRPYYQRGVVKVQRGKCPQG